MCLLHPLLFHSVDVLISTTHSCSRLLVCIVFVFLNTASSRGVVLLHIFFICHQQSDFLLIISIPCCISRWAFVGISNQSRTDVDRIVRAWNSCQPVYSFCSSAFFSVRTILRSIILHAHFAFTCGCICVCTSSMIYMKPVSGAEKNKVKKAV